jgi:glyoxylase-like metal-dependent hydrolase (beta-lactamase superfamily II)
MGLTREEMAERFAAAGLTLFERGWLSCNNVLFEGDESVLVDSGYWSHAEQTVDLVRHALGGAPLDRLINTHLHSDHCGGNQALQRAFGCRIDVPAGEAWKVDTWDEARLSYRDTGQHCPRFERHGMVREGESVRLGQRTWEVLAAPGHDPEAVVLYQRDLKLLLSADALWENGFGVVFPEIEGVDAFSAVAETLDLIDGLDVDIVIPGHGAPFAGVGAAIGRARAKLDAFVASPSRHARHAAKVLVKFHLLEYQRVRDSELFAWMESTRYMQLLQQRYFAQPPLRTWSLQLVDELCVSGALRRAGEMVLNA